MHSQLALNSPQYKDHLKYRINRSPKQIPVLPPETLLKWSANYREKNLVQSIANIWQGAQSFQLPLLAFSSFLQTAILQQADSKIAGAFQPSY